MVTVRVRGERCEDAGVVHTGIVRAVVVVVAIAIHRAAHGDARAYAGCVQLIAHGQRVVIITGAAHLARGRRAAILAVRYAVAVGVRVVRRTGALAAGIEDVADGAGVVVVAEIRRAAGRERV